MGTTNNTCDPGRITKLSKNLDTPQWLAICNIEDKRAAQRVKDKGKKKGEIRNAPGKLFQGGKVTNWKQALAQLAVAYPDRVNKYL